MTTSHNQQARSLGTRNEMPFDSRAKGPPANRREKGYGGDNGYSIVETNVSRAKWTTDRYVANESYVTIVMFLASCDFSLFHSL